MTKRLLDVVLASVALIALAPVLAVAALGIRLSSRGPILYRARLVGLCGRRFVMYKLRTMHVDHGGQKSVITAERDPRVLDRKSTRLNSSHTVISYAVFCLKKKKNKCRVINTTHQ